MTNIDSTPKKSKSKLFALIALILMLFGISEYKLHFILGTDVSVTDTSIVVTPTQISQDSIIHKTIKDSVNATH